MSYYFSPISIFLMVMIVFVVGTGFVMTYDWEKNKKGKKKTRQN